MTPLTAAEAERDALINSDNAPPTANPFGQRAATIARLRNDAKIILEGHEMTLADGLLHGFFDQAGPIEDGAANPITYQAWLLRFEGLVTEYRFSLLPPKNALPRNGWADSELTRMNFIRRASLTYPAGTQDAKERIYRALGVTDEASLIYFPGNQDKAMSCIVRDVKEMKAAMAAKQDSKPLWTDKHGQAVDELAQANNIPATYVAQMVKGALGGKTAEEASKTQHPDGIIKTIEMSIPAWKEAHKLALAGQQALFTPPPAPVIGDEIDRAMDNLSEGAKKLQAIMEADDKVNGSAPISNGEAAPLSETPAAGPDTQPVATEALPGPVSEKPEPDIILEEENDLDGREYEFGAVYSQGVWMVAVRSYVTLTDPQKVEIISRTTGYLKLSHDAPPTFGWTTQELTVEQIDTLRTDAYKIIENAYGPDYEGKAGEDRRIAVLKDIWKDAPQQGTKGAWLHFGRKGAMQRVHSHCAAKLKADTEAMAARHEEESRRFEEKALAVIDQPKAAALVLTSPDSPIKVPTEPEMRLMDKLAGFAVRCNIYPNEAAAFLAIYRGFELGFGISASIELINAFVGQGNKINIYVTANGYAAKCLSTPSICARFTVANDTDESAIAIVQRVGGAQQTFHYGKEDAIKAGLWNNEKRPAWKANPRAMLRHRVAREAAITAFSDLCAGMVADPDSDDNLFNAGELQKVVGF